MRWLVFITPQLETCLFTAFKVPHDVDEVNYDDGDDDDDRNTDTH
jgi:hypothetical protein